MTTIISHLNVFCVSLSSVNVLRTVCACVIVWKLSLRCGLNCGLLQLQRYCRLFRTPIRASRTMSCCFVIKCYEAGTSCCACVRAGECPDALGETTRLHQPTQTQYGCHAFVRGASWPRRKTARYGVADAALGRATGSSIERIISGLLGRRRCEECCSVDPGHTQARHRFTRRSQRPAGRRYPYG